MEPEAKADTYFGFKSGRGIHDIHFNQGNPPGFFAADNGPFQDGGLIFEFPADAGPSLWVTIFMKFQSQAWHIADAGGAPILPRDPDHPGRPHTPVERDGILTLTVPDSLVRIVGALLNTADVPVDLAGWAILDRAKHRQVLDGSLAAGETRKIALRDQLSNPVRLSNKGGLITLVDADEIRVHGVSYTAAQARQPGRTIPFQQ